MDIGVQYEIESPLEQLKPQVTIEGVSYTYEKLLLYMKENGQKFSKEVVCKKLEELKKLSLKKIAEKEDMVLLINTKEVPLLYRGNPLFIAIHAGDEALIRSMLKKRIPMKDGTVIPLVEKKQQFYYYEMVNIELLAVLLAFPKELSMEIWCELWEYYAEQVEHDNASELKWPCAGALGMRLWLDNLELLLQEKPELYKRVVTERFFNRIMLAVHVDKDIGKTHSKKEYRELVKRLERMRVPLQNPELPWEVVVEWKQRNDQGLYCSYLAEIGTYLNLWKRMSKKALVADMEGTARELFEDMRWCLAFDSEFLDGVAFFQIILEVVDVVKYAELLDLQQIFRYIIAEGNEDILLLSLRKDLISGTVLPRAFRYAEEEKQNWAIPLLMLKQHGEWNPEELYEK